MDHSPPALRESVPHHAGGSHRQHRNCPAEPPDTRDVPQLDTPGHSHQLHLPLITDISHLADYPLHGITLVAQEMLRAGPRSARALAEDLDVRQDLLERGAAVDVAAGEDELQRAAPAVAGSALS
jgi:hypothetical protein